MILLKYLEEIVFVIALFMVFWAAAIIYSRPFGGRNSTVYRLRLMARARQKTSSLLSRLQNDRLERLLTSAGKPLSLNSVNYSLIRITILGGSMLYINLAWLLGEHRYPYNVACLFIALFILTQPCKGLPVFYLLEKIKELRIREKNKECFTLYSMIQNEFYSYGDKPLNMYSTLYKLKPYFKSIDKALGKAILLWKRNPSQAMDAFAEEVGTEEARDLAQILKNVDASSPKDAKDILDSRYEQFITKRHESHRRHKNNIGLVSYVAALLPVFAVIYNVMVIFNLEKQALLKFIYQR